MQTSSLAPALLACSAEKLSLMFQQDSACLLPFRACSRGTQVEWFIEDSSLFPDYKTFDMSHQSDTFENKRYISFYKVGMFSHWL